MKNFIAALLGITLAGVPALAEPNVKPFSLEAQGCMKLRECQRNVHRVTDISHINNHFNDYYPDDVEQELAELIEKLNRSGVEVFIADSTYFPSNTRGLYYTDVNRLFLNKAHVYMPQVMLSVLRHEGWHAAQDCMAGTIDNTFIAVIYGDEIVPDSYQLLADVRYGLLMPKAVPWEMEAMWAADVKEMTLNALYACTTGAMWDLYEPTPMTREWLIKNGYISQ